MRTTTSIKVMFMKPMFIRVMLITLLLGLFPSASLLAADPAQQVDQETDPATSSPPTSNPATSSPAINKEAEKTDEAVTETANDAGSETGKKTSDKTTVAAATPKAGTLRNKKFSTAIEQFIPTEAISADNAVPFPVDI